MHWSELSSDVIEQVKQRKRITTTNRKLFQNVGYQFGGNLINWWTTGEFESGEANSGLVLGEKIAEGAQAEIYRATYPEDKFSESEVILKVFKLEGASLRDLQHQLSRGLMESDMFEMRLLRERNIPHKDLKASNVLVRPYDEKLYDNVQCPLPSDNFDCLVADFECSGGVVGTGFWREPQTLRASKDKVT